MRKQDKIIIWSAYFDSSKTRKEGRRVPKNLAVQSPKTTEISDAAAKIGLEPELITDKGYSKVPWVKAGMVLVEKQGSKEEVIQKIAEQLLKIRNEQQRLQAK